MSDEYEGLDGGEDYDGLGADYDPSLTAGYGFDPQQAYDAGAAGFNATATALGETMRGMAAAAAREQLDGALGQLVHESQQRENARIVSLVDETVSKLEQKHPGVNWRDEQFVEFAGRFGLGEAETTTPDRLADELEQARVAYDAVQERERRAETRRRDQAVFERIKNADRDFRVGTQ